MSDPKPRKRKRKKSPVKTFFKIVISIVLIFIIVSAGAVFAYNKLVKKENQEEGQNQKPQSGKDIGFFDAIMGKGIQLNVAVFGTDEDGTRTDVIFVVHFDSKAQQVNLLSIPRDTRVELSDEVMDILDDANRNYSKTCKINAVHAYGGKDYGPEVAVKQLEDLLGIKIDHYAKVDLEGFRQIVDAIGGVDVDVPQDMKYSDPYQDLYVNLKAGYQHLDGDKAEQLVRFRSYPQGDVARVQVQQLFLKEFARKVLSTESILGNIGDYINIAYKYLKTDLSLTDALKYSRYISDINLNNVQMETLPGEGKYIGDVSYFVYDEDVLPDTVDRLFLGKDSIGETDSQIMQNSKELNIEVANGGIIEGLAGRTRDKLEEEGYQIKSISTYNGERKDYTRIIVKEKGIGEDLKEYFEGSKIEVNSSLLEKDIDIKIILGLDEK